MYSKIIALTTLLLLSSSNFAAVILDHLSIPANYDNSNSYPNDWGQTFTATDDSLIAIRLYIGDPNRPDNTVVNELVGPATVRLYDASSLSSPILLKSTEFLTSGSLLSGLSTINFDSSIATTVGNRYFFSISAPDHFGFGMRSLSESTYAGGSEAIYDFSSDQIVEVSSGRDLSFQILKEEPTPPTAVFEPQVSWLFLLGLAGMFYRKF